MSKQTPAAFLSIKTQFDNLGDALINRELCRLVAGRAETWIDFSRAPLDFERAMDVGGLPNVTVFRKAGFIRLLGEIAHQRFSGRPCYLFLNPGGLGGGRLLLKSKLSAIVYNVLLSIMRRAGVRICHAGISFDAMRGPELTIARWRRRLLHSFTVRDQLSLRYVGSIDMQADAIVPDLSFNLYSAPPPAAPGDRTLIALSFRFDGKASDQTIDAAVRRVLQTHGTGCEYLFVAQVARDAAGMKRLRALATDAGLQSRLLICIDDIDELCDIYASCRAIYSNRLHALLMAAYAGAAPYAMIASGRQPKIEGMFQDLGLSEALVFIDRQNWRLPEVRDVDDRRFRDEQAKLRAHFDALLGCPMERAGALQP